MSAACSADLQDGRLDPQRHRYDQFPVALRRLQDEGQDLPECPDPRAAQFEKRPALRRARAAIAASATSPTKTGCIRVRRDHRHDRRDPRHRAKAVEEPVLRPEDDRGPQIVAAGKAASTARRPRPCSCIAAGLPDRRRSPRPAPAAAPRPPRRRGHGSAPSACTRESRRRGSRPGCRPG